MLLLHPATDENTQDINTEVPPRAFSAKMLDIIEIVGTEGVSTSGTMLEMIKQEKATSDLKRLSGLRRHKGFTRYESGSVAVPTHEVVSLALGTVRVSFLTN